MNVGWCSSPSEITTPCVEGLRCSNKNLLGGKPFDNIGHLTKKVDFLSFSSHSGKVPISAHLHPGHLEGSYVGKRQLQEATPKLDVVRTLLIDNYDSYTYNIYQELSVINGLPPVVIRNDAWTWDDVIYYLYEKKAFDNIVISPGPGSPACPDDIGICLRLLLECKDLPILGVCLGHQALGYVHGAHIVYADEPVHGRLSEIEHNGCKLFQDIPSGKNSGFEVVRYHSLVIESESLPKELVPIAWTTSAEAHSLLDIQSNIVSDDCASQRIKVANGSWSSKFGHKISWLSSHVEGLGPRKVLMGVKHLTRPHYGVQFHPESVATRYGRQIFDNFKQMTMDYWRRSRSPVLNGKKFYNTVQVPEASLLSREVPGSLEGTNNAAKDYHGMHNLVNNLHSRTHKPLKLRWRKIDSLVSQVDGARKIFSELFGGERAENTFWLDSSSTEKRRARFSFMGGKGGSLWKQLTYRLSDSGAVSTGGFLSVEDAQGSTESTFLEDGFLDYLNKELLSYHYESEDYKGLPFDFCGGYVGYIGYNLKAECGDISNQHRSGTPDACFFFADNLVVIDHYCDDVYILSLDDGTTTSWIENTEQKLLNLKSSGRKTFRNQASRVSTLSSSNAGFIPDKSREQYKKDVENCLKFIRDGESYELCLTTQFRKAIGEIDMLGFYLHLREKNPSPYAAWLNFSKDNLCICCSSPERFLQLDRNGILEAKPIKGTVARGRMPEEDELLKMQLKHSEKDQAENLMIVDLLRNDLGRVCEPGSVHVPHLMEVESYATVHTMVSTIRGEKKTDISPVECVRAAFPGGSMTGAPKLRSMELLDSLESCSRGVYSGCIGYFSYNQTFDLNIVIRTVVIHKGEASIGAGGAIVALSNPENEYEEMMLKTRAPASAVLEYENWLPLDQ